MAMDVLVKVNSGNDPLSERKKLRSALTVRDLADRFNQEQIAVHLNLTTAKEYRRNLKLLILPALGSMRINDVSRTDVARLDYDWHHKPYQANRNLEIVSKMFNMAELWGLRPDGTNLGRHIKKYAEKKRERCYFPAELRAIGHTFFEMEHERIELPSDIAAGRLLLLTGCRLNENLRLRWEYVDFESKMLRLPDSKTGTKSVLVGASAIGILNGITRDITNPFVIIGRNPAAHLTELQPIWQRVRARAG